MPPTIINPGKQKLLPLPAILAPGGSQSIRDIAGDYWFGPLQPIAPVAPAGFRPRQWGYTPGANLNWMPKSEDGSPITFDVLRALADSWDILQIVLQTRLDQISRTKFEIRAKQKPGEKAADYKARAAGDDTLKKLNDFMASPDGIHPFRKWVRMWAEDMQVIDAVALYLERDKEGKVASVHPLDGATINRCLTEQGFTPPPPSVAYQQVIYGLPMCNLTTNDLIYSMRNERTHKRYGHSRVEQILLTITLGLRRQEWMIQEFTSGNTPEALVFLPGDMHIDRVKEIQDWFDTMLSGNLAERRKLRFLPGFGTGDSAKPNIVFPKEPLLKTPVEEWLAQCVCMHFGISPQGFMKMMNRATAEQSADSSKEEGLEPDLNEVADVLNALLALMGFGDNYEAVWQQARDVDPLKQAQADNLLAGKIRPVNEIREERGLEPIDVPEANMLGSYTPAGFVPLGQQAPTAAATSQNSASKEGEKPEAGGKGKPNGEAAKTAVRRGLLRRAY